MAQSPGDYNEFLMPCRLAERLTQVEELNEAAAADRLCPDL